MKLKSQPIYKGVHKTLCINFRACAAFFPKIMYISLLDRNDNNNNNVFIEKHPIKLHI